jgi:hypothetical protein
LVAAVTVAALTAWFRQHQDRGDAYQQFLMYLSLWLPQVAILLAMLWLLRQTSYAKRWDRDNGHRNWQFSMSHLLAIMTASAIVLVTLRIAEEMHQYWVEVAAWTSNNVTLAIAALVIYSTRWHAMLRLGAIVGVSLALAFGITRFTGGDPNAILVNIVQVIVLFLWLAIGEIVPSPRRSTTKITQV